MINIDRARVGLFVLVEDKGFLIPGVIMAIDPKSREFGVKKVYSDAMERFPAAKVHTRYPYNGLAAPTMPSPKDGNLLRLLGGYIKKLSEGGAINLATLKEVAEALCRAGIAPENVSAQEIIEILH